METLEWNVARTSHEVFAYLANDALVHERPHMVCCRALHIPAWPCDDELRRILAGVTIETDAGTWSAAEVVAVCHGGRVRAELMGLSPPSRAHLLRHDRDHARLDPALAAVEVDGPRPHRVRDRRQRYHSQVDSGAARGRRRGGAGVRARGAGRRGRSTTEGFGNIGLLCVRHV